MSSDPWEGSAALSSAAGADFSRKLVQEGNLGIPGGQGKLLALLLGTPLWEVAVPLTLAAGVVLSVPIATFL